MTRVKLQDLLSRTGLFTTVEIHEIVRACGRYTVGNAIIACEVIGITLTGNDIDIIISDYLRR